MCNDYAREIEAGRVIAAMEEIKDVPPFSYMGGRIPNDAAPTPHINIRDKGLVVRLREERLEGEMMTWAWLQGKRPVFNFVSEDRDFSKSDRCLILATSFYEYTGTRRAQAEDQVTGSAPIYVEGPGVVLDRRNRQARMFRHADGRSRARHQTLSRSPDRSVATRAGGGMGRAISARSPTSKGTA
jgi:hypothetical protein